MELKIKPRRSFVIVLIAFVFATWVTNYLTGCRSVQKTKDVGANAQESQELRLLIPQSVWEPFFFKEINQRTTEANLPNLRTLLPNGDVEARVWFAVSHYGI